MRFLDVKTDYAFENENMINRFKLLEKDTFIKNALDIVNEANLSQDELEAQHKRKEFISIQKLAIMKAKKDGLTQGLYQGIEQGEKNKQIEIAKNLLDILDYRYYRFKNWFIKTRYTKLIV